MGVVLVTKYITSYSQDQGTDVLDVNIAAQEVWCAVDYY